MMNAYERGMSLLEILLGLLVVSLLMLQLSQVFVMCFKYIFKYEAMVETQENINSSAFFLAYFIPYTGYVGVQKSYAYTLDNVVPDGVFPVSVDFQSQEYIKGLDDISNDRSVKKKTDVLMLRFYAPDIPNLRDCKNSRLVANDLVQIDFYIDRDNQLRCKGVADSSNRRASAVLATNIEDFQVMYAYRNTDQDIFFCDALCISSKNVWKQVIAVRVYMQMEQSAVSVPQIITTYVLAHVN